MNESEIRACDKEKVADYQVDDDNERFEEKCWKEEYKGASRKWLIRDASSKDPPGLLCSTMKETYLYPKRENSDEKNMGKKHKYLKKKFYEEAIEELQNENKGTTEPNDYCTEYDGNFQIEGFKPDDKYYLKNNESIQQYPLYSSAPISYYSFNQRQNPKNVLHGLTRITDHRNIFKRNGQFSKPIAESLDYAEL